MLSGAEMAEPVGYRTRMRVKEEEQEEEEGESWKKKRKRKEVKRRRRAVVQRWSEARCRAAEQSMFDVLVAEGATFESPMTRTALRTAARERIGDTGLLDHLLKHLKGKAAPGGTHRFQRWFNSDGVMEYWLESADLVPLAPKRPNNAHMQHHLNNQVGDMFKEMVRWNAQTDQNLQVILSSWKSMQDMYEGLVTWKAKVEQQIAEIKSALESKQQQQQQQPESSPQGSERWEDWLDEDAVGTEVVPWFDTNTLTTNTDTKPAAAAAAAVDLANDSSTTPDSLSGFRTCSFLCQEHFVELFNWKARMEQKVAEISDSVDLIRKGEA